MIILASNSPRRKELLSELGINFAVVPPHGEEIFSKTAPPDEIVVSLARAKAHEVAQNYPHDIIIGADTIVVHEKKILGKPESAENAAEMLTSLSGKQHAVYTGVCVVKNGEEFAFAEMTRVEFFKLSQEEISSYVQTGEPLDKAGAYGIQGKGKVLVRRIEGDYYNVVGLPVARLWRLLKKLM